MSKIVFIEPKPPNFHIFSKFMSPRLGTFILGNLMKQRGWEVEVYIEDMGQVDWDRVPSADIVGISSITSTAPRAYKIADKVREMGIPVIMGGAHPTFLTKEALRHADFVIRGEGEDPLMAFIDAWEKTGDFSRVPALSYKKNGNVIHNPTMKATPDMDNIPFPDFSLYKGKNKILKQGSTVPIQTSRGCPFHCSFCAVTPMFGKSYRFRSVENILQELRQYQEGNHFIFFYDDNFAARPQHTKELLKAMIREKLHFRWSAQVRVDVAKDLELVELMKKAGCHTVFIGFESINPKSLDQMKKSQGVDDIVRAIKVLRKHHIHIHGMFILGLDDDNWKTVKKTVRFAKKYRLNSGQFMIMTPLPGCELYYSLIKENRILFKDWSLYDAHHVVFKPINFSESRLQTAQIYCHKKFYSILERIKKLVKGDLNSFFINLYARHLNRIWKKKNKPFLKVLKLLKSNRNADITVDYREKVIVP
jgi:radical SAM superfamily enzyme YgiQ (UPF0313 family)